MNMNGTALFEGATVLFLAQVFGVDLSLGRAARGGADVGDHRDRHRRHPGRLDPAPDDGAGMVGVPMEGIAIVLGVDRILDMCRTVLNVTGDLVTATIVQRSRTAWAAPRRPSPRPPGFSTGTRAPPPRRRR